MSLRKLTAILLLPFLVVVSGCGESPTQPAPKTEPADSHSRMLALLQGIKDRTPEERDELSDRRYRNFLSQLESLPSSAPPSQRLYLHERTGFFALLNGQNELAIDHLVQAWQLLPELRRQMPSNSIDEQGVESLEFEVAVAYLRLGETQNCVHCQTGESCILPIRPGGVHQKQTGSRKAIEYLLRILNRNPDHLASRWLLNIAYMTLGEYPDKVPKQLLIPPKAFESEEEFPRFVNVAKDLGIDNFSLSGGSIVDDFDGDGWLDIVVSSSRTSDELRYYRNNGDGTFTDQSEAAGFSGIYGGLNIIQADYDNDGDLDILVLRGAWLLDLGRRYPNSLLQNDGNGRFRDVTFEVGIGDLHFPTQTAAWADYDNDGDLDLFIGNEQFPCQLFVNDGHGKFVDRAEYAGVLNGRITKGVVWGDFNGDRFPDLYVSNLANEKDGRKTGGSNRLYRNNRDGTFTDVAKKLAVRKPYSSFPTWFWDFNNDGHLDIYVASCLWDVDDVAADYLNLPYNVEMDCLYQSDGEGGFREVLNEQNLAHVTHPMGANFGDLDNDGFPDFYLGTGAPRYEVLTPNRMFHNLRGTGFADVSTAGGFGHLQKGHGVSFADLDHDGDQDVYHELGGSLAGDGFGNALFENPGFGNHWITIRLVGKQSNSFGIGARIKAEIEENGKRRNVYQWVNSGGSFGANPLRQHIGLGAATNILSLEVFWPTSDQTQKFQAVDANQFIEITEGKSEYRRLEYKAIKFRSSTVQSSASVEPK